MAEAKFTTDHDEIREWAEARGGRPAAVRKTHGKDDPGIIRIEFPDAPNAKDAALEEITWEEFFAKHGEKQGKPYEFREAYSENAIVTHPKFGPGVIVDAEGQGMEARVQVNFGNQGLKWLAVAVAKLQAA